jgi:hypothetical protein
VWLLPPQCPRHGSGCRFDCLWWIQVCWVSSLLTPFYFIVNSSQRHPHALRGSPQS